MNNLTISNAGIKFITQFEGLKLKPYNDSAGYATVGIGHLIRKAPVTPSDPSITEEDAYALFRVDSLIAQEAVNRLVKVPLTQNQFDALVSWTYNLGVGALEHSTALEYLNKGLYATAIDHFTLYDKAGGKYVPGLARRRQAEAFLFLTHTN